MPKYEIGKVLEHPVFFEHVKDRIEKIPGNSDDGLVRAASRFDALVEVAQAGIVALGDECTPRRHDVGDLLPYLAVRSTRGLSSGLLTLGVIPGKATGMPLLHEFLDVDDVAQQSNCPDFSNALD